MAHTVPPIASWVGLLLLYLVTVQGVFSRESTELSSREVRRVNEKDMLVELQDVLEKLQAKRILSWEAKLNQLPKCVIGEFCAVKRGSRIGKLCDCPRRSSCNYYFLKCL
ncbi:hypothetical protein GDO86_019037 [Hymenochirus boettgeri]|uniref:Cocaine- and amphetamine-regulated transcript protein n=1 Tax=Hymenochirus boettgeri TaxID=247094 RepID=A0A8T2IH11_9PIPI|nr:hypothetical protein GDO86_019037 [Hymenochirus boettgeri]